MMSISIRSQKNLIFIYIFRKKQAIVLYSPKATEKVDRHCCTRITLYSVCKQILSKLICWILKPILSSVLNGALPILMNIFNHVCKVRLQQFHREVTGNQIMDALVDTQIYHQTRTHTDTLKECWLEVSYFRCGKETISIVWTESSSQQVCWYPVTDIQKASQQTTLMFTWKKKTTQRFFYSSAVFDIAWFQAKRMKGRKQIFFVQAYAAGDSICWERNATSTQPAGAVTGSTDNICCL